jgi:hypothetical protein
MINGYTKKKEFAPIKIYKEEQQKLMKKAGELTAIEGKRVSVPEIIRRTFNIQNLDNVLRNDSILNKRGTRK